jgi:transketolase
VRSLERRAPLRPEDLARGAYAVQDPGAATRVVFVATGSEVALACDAAEKLGGEGIPARVVSMPCIELFLEQPLAVQRALVPSDGTPVVAVEAGRAESLRRFVGPRGLVYGIDRFGASAPLADLARFFGFTPDQLAGRVVEHLRALEAAGSPRASA